MATQFLDDVIQGHQVIQSLDVTDLPAGEHKFWFRIATNSLSLNGNICLCWFSKAKNRVRKS